VIVFVTAALLSACGPATAPTVEDAAPTSPTAPTEATLAPAVSLPATVSPQAPPTETRQVVSEQYATDPATVNLAAGRPTRQVLRLLVTCRRLAPVVHGLEAEWGEQVNFVYPISMTRRRNSRQLGYRVQPHMFLIDGDGQVLQQWLGYVDGETLEAALQQATG
jgi:hypothetical protein